MACKRTVGPRESECQPSDALKKGHMHFFKILLDSVIQEKKLMIPPKFARKYGDELSTVATLSIANGRVWRVGLTKTKNGIYFHDGWYEFVEYFSIRHGHLLVFSYKGISNFHVLIFDMTACEINYPLYGPISEQESNHDKQYPAINDGEMEDDDSLEILGFMTPLGERVFNKSSKKQAMNKRFNPSSNHSCHQRTACMDSSKNGNGYETRSKKCKMQDQVEIIDLDNVKESRQGKISKNEMSSSYGSLLDKSKDNNQHPNKNAENLLAPVHDSGIQINRSKIKINCLCVDIHSQFNEDEHTKTANEVGSTNKNTKPCEDELSKKSEDDVKIIVGQDLFRRCKKPSQERERVIHAAKLFNPKNPSFIVILRPYSVRMRKSSLCVPFAFAKKYLSRDSEYLTLQNSDGREWPVRINWRLTHGPDLTTGWNKFSSGNNLEEGDACVFELIKTNEVVLKVSIFHVSME